MEDWQWHRICSQDLYGTQLTNFRLLYINYRLIYVKGQTTTSTTTTTPTTTAITTTTNQPTDCNEVVSWKGAKFSKIYFTGLNAEMIRIIVLNNDKPNVNIRKHPYTGFLVSEF